jgi:hypothetical protein
MRKHRRTQDTVSNNHHDDNVRNDDLRKDDPRNDNFDPADALETLHASILRLETLVQVASRAADELRCRSSPTERRALTRMQILIGKAAEEASAVLAEGDKVMADLAEHRLLTSVE